MSRQFRKFPSFIFHHFRFFRLLRSLTLSGFCRPSHPIMFESFRHSYSIISGIFRLPPVLADRNELDPGLFSLETETQQYVLLGISS